jgi:hypothetical protein
MRLLLRTRDFLELLDNERKWFELLNALRRQRWQRAWPEERWKGRR